MMEFKDKIVDMIAEKECERISKKVIRLLQRMPSGLSGEDSGLKNAWDEICVQVQGEESVDWGVYEETVESLILSELKTLDQLVLAAIWFQTDDGMMWDDEDGDKFEDGSPVFSIEDVSYYLMTWYVFSTAGNWRNKRIEDYQGREALGGFLDDKFIFEHSSPAS